MQIFCCHDDVELAFQEIIDKYETPPVFNEVDKDKKLSTVCKYCKNTAVYIVTNECSHT